MDPMRRSKFLSLPVFLLLAISLSAQVTAPEVADIAVFGDSLSDVGNVSALSFGLIPGSPYFMGRFSDGPLWVDGLAAGLGVPLVANGADESQIVGNGFAFGAARTLLDEPIYILPPPFPPAAVIPSVVNQVNGYLGALGGPIPPDRLIVLSGGANDLRDAADPANGLSPAQQLAIAQTAAGGVESAILALHGAGARIILVTNAPDLGLIPESQIVLGNAAAATAISLAYNQDLALRIASLRASLDVCIVELDLFGLIGDIVDDALGNGGGVYGITNVTTPIFAGFAGSPGAPAATSLFADDIHPSAVAHAVAAQAALDALADPALPGSAEDLELRLEVGGLALPAACGARATTGQQVDLVFGSPAGTFLGKAAYLVGQGFPTGATPLTPPGFPEVWVDPAATIILGIFGVTTSPTTIGAAVQPGLAGTTIRFQVIVSDPNAANGFFASTDARDLLLY